jgi:acylpyruvate hydrolase
VQNVNRIFCIGRNYAEHIRELDHAGAVNAPDGDCVVFMKPPSCIVSAGGSVHLPVGRGAVHHEAELVVRIGSGGRDIPVETAMRHVSHITLGLDLTLRDLQTQLKNRGAPWELSKSFDGAAPLGDWAAYTGADLQALEFTCHVNGQLRQFGHTRDMLYPVARQIHILSQTWALQPGDIIYTGTPKGVGPLMPGDQLSLFCAQIGRSNWRFE